MARPNIALQTYSSELAGAYGNRTHRRLSSSRPLVLKTRARTSGTHAPEGQIHSFLSLQKYPAFVQHAIAYHPGFYHKHDEQNQIPTKGQTYPSVAAVIHHPGHPNHCHAGGDHDRGSRRRNRHLFHALSVFGSPRFLLCIRLNPCIAHMTLTHSSTIRGATSSFSSI